MIYLDLTRHQTGVKWPSTTTAIDYLYNFHLFTNRFLTLQESQKDSILSDTQTPLLFKIAGIMPWKYRHIHCPWQCLVMGQKWDIQWLKWTIIGLLRLQQRPLCNHYNPLMQTNQTWVVICQSRPTLPLFKCLMTGIAQLCWIYQNNFLKRIHRSVKSLSLLVEKNHVSIPNIDYSMMWMLRALWLLLPMIYWSLCIDVNATHTVNGRYPWSFRVQIHGWCYGKLVFFVLFNMALGFENGCEIISD